MVTFRASATTNLVKSPVTCLLQRIVYGGGGGSAGAIASATGGGKAASSSSTRDSGLVHEIVLDGADGEDTSGWGAWDVTKRTVRPATAEETASLAAFEAKLLAYQSGDRTPPPPVTPPVEEIATPTPAVGKGKASPAKSKAKGKGKEPEPAPAAVPSRPSSATTKGKAVVATGPPVCPVEVAGTSQGVLMVYARVSEPAHEIDKSHPDQTVVVTCNAVADAPKFTCESHQGKINFRPTYMLQSTVHRFTVTNDSKVSLPIRWTLEDIKQRKVGQRGASMGSRRPLSFGQNPHIGPPFTVGGYLSIYLSPYHIIRAHPTTYSNSLNHSLITSSDDTPFDASLTQVEPSDCVVPPNDTKEFKLTFLPLDADDYVYLLTGETIGGASSGGDPHSPPVDGSTPLQGQGQGLGSIRMVCRGSAVRPVCHFELKESPDYLSQRPGNLKNEFGMLSPIECTDIKVGDPQHLAQHTLSLTLTLSQHTLSIKSSHCRHPPLSYPSFPFHRWWSWSPRACARATRTASTSSTPRATTTSSSGRPWASPRPSGAACSRQVRWQRHSPPPPSIPVNQCNQYNLSLMTLSINTQSSA